MGGSGGALGELWEAQGQLWEALGEPWEALYIEKLSIKRTAAVMLDSPLIPIGRGTGILV